MNKKFLKYKRKSLKYKKKKKNKSKNYNFIKNKDLCKLRLQTFQKPKKIKVVDVRRPIQLRCRLNKMK